MWILQFRVQVFHRDMLPRRTRANDAFTQSNPNVVTSNPLAISSTLPVSVKKGVLGGSVAFTRPDAGSNTIGGAVLVATAPVVNTRPLGLFINDALGNAFENTPGVASGKGPFVRGGAVGVKIYETQQQTTNGGGAVGDALTTYANGQKLYASINGYLTNRWQDSYEYAWINGVSGSGAGLVCIEPDVTTMGIVLSGPDSTSAELFAELKF